jgi:hypothetical protein
MFGKYINTGEILQYREHFACEPREINQKSDLFVPKSFRPMERPRCRKSLQAKDFKQTKGVPLNGTKNPAAFDSVRYPRRHPKS